MNLLTQTKHQHACNHNDYGVYAKVLKSVELLKALVEQAQNPKRDDLKPTRSIFISENVQKVFFYTQKLREKMQECTEQSSEICHYAGEASAPSGSFALCYAVSLQIRSKLSEHFRS